MKTKYPVNIMVFRVVTSDGDVMPPLIFWYYYRPNMKANIKCLKEVNCSESRGWLLEDPISGKRALHHVTQAKEPSVGCKKFSATTSPLTSPKIAIPLIIMWGAWLSERPTKLYAILKMNWKQKNGSIYQFKQGDHLKSLQEIPKSSGAIVEANGNFFK